MIKKHVSILAKIGVMALFPGLANALPNDVRQVVDKACTQEDSYVSHAVVRAAQIDYPTYKNIIQKYWDNGCTLPATAAPAPLDKEVKAPETVTKDGFITFGANLPVTGEAEAALDIRTGNTEQKDMLARLKLQYDKDDTKWRHTFGALARSNQDDGTTTAEEYRVDWRTDYQFEKYWFAFGELGYVKDRFSGYQYRVSETVGIGHILYEGTPLDWEVRAGVGLRQDKLTNGKSENNGVITLATDLDWEIREGLTFFEHADASISPESTILQSETGIKSLLIDNLSLKAAFYIEHITDVPDDTKDTDTRTTLGLLYDF